MKLTPLLISILVFLMSGVMCLFSNSEVFAQVPQTKRGDQDSFLKNIRAKKRNNDLQKARRAKGRSSKSNKERNLSLIFNSGYSNFDSTPHRSFSETIFIKTKVNNLQLIYKWFGLGLNQYSGKKYTGDILDKEFKINGYQFLLNVGDPLSLTFGRNFYTNGIARRIESGTDNQKYFIKSEDIETENPGLFFNSITLNIHFKFLVFSVSHNYTSFYFKKYRCDDAFCEDTDPSSFDDQSYPTETNLVGIGFKF